MLWDLREIAAGSPKTVPNANLGGPSRGVPGGIPKADKLPNGRFVTHSIYGSYGGASICPKTGHTVYGNLLKLSENKWFRLNALRSQPFSLLKSVALGGFDSYYFDYRRRAPSSIIDAWLWSTSRARKPPATSTAL
jgi:hypothetical protein